MKNIKQDMTGLSSSLFKKIAKLRYFFSGQPNPINEAESTLTKHASLPRQQALLRGVNPRSVRLIWLILASVLLLLTWAAFAELDVIVRGMGQVVPTQRVQQIQNLEGGILRELLVQEGDQVEKGSLLARIDNESAGSQYREAVVRSLDYQATISRLEAIVNGGEPEYSPEVLAEPKLVERHNNILYAIRDQIDSELQVLELQCDSRNREAKENEARKVQLIASLNIAQRQRNLAAKALRAKAYSALEFLNLEQRVQSLNMDITALEHSIPRLYIEAQEMVERLAQRKAEVKAQYSTEIGDTQASLFSLLELLKAGSDKVKRTEMRSPVRGIIKRIHNTTVGGVVAPGATLMEIVPIDDSLIIEARFSPADIAFLYPGLKAIVRLTAYDFSVYGSMDAEVEHISADTLSNNQGDIFYIVKVRTKYNSLHSQGRNLPIIAGMQAEIDVLTGKKTVLDYILKPLLKVRDRAFREQ